MHLYHSQFGWTGPVRDPREVCGGGNSGVLPPPGGGEDEEASTVVKSGSFPNGDFCRGLRRAVGGKSALGNVFDRADKVGGNSANSVRGNVVDRDRDREELLPLWSVGPGGIETDFRRRREEEEQSGVLSWSLEPQFVEGAGGTKATGEAPNSGGGSKEEGEEMSGDWWRERPESLAGGGGRVKRRRKVFVPPGTEEL